MSAKSKNQNIIPQKLVDPDTLQQGDQTSPDSDTQRIDKLERQVGTLINLLVKSKIIDQKTATVIEETKSNDELIAWYMDYLKKKELTR